MSHIPRYWIFLEKPRLQYFFIRIQKKIVKIPKSEKIHTIFSKHIDFE